MTDYELVYFFIEYLNALQTAVMNYVAVLFAFLIAAYLIAGKVQSSMVPIIVGLFTLVALNQLSLVIGNGYDWAAVGFQITARAAEGTSNVGWHGVATPWGPHAVSITRFGAAAVLILSYIGALTFFFHQRKVGRAQ